MKRTLNYAAWHELRGRQTRNDRKGNYHTLAYGSSFRHSHGMINNKNPFSAGPQQVFEPGTAQVHSTAIQDVSVTTLTCPTHGLQLIQHP
jgi:hypothetical protein